MHWMRKRIQNLRIAYRWSQKRLLASTRDWVMSGKRLSGCSTSIRSPNPGCTERRLLAGVDACDQRREEQRESKRFKGQNNNRKMHWMQILSFHEFLANLIDLTFVLQTFRFFFFNHWGRRCGRSVIKMGRWNAFTFPSYISIEKYDSVLFCQRLWARLSLLIGRISKTRHHTALRD